MDIKTQFKPFQIVCLEQDNCYLYCEVIQVITTRELCWVRPLVLVRNKFRTPAKLSLDSSLIDSFIEEKDVVDVRLTSDLIFPINLFRAALDVEVMPILTHLEKMDWTNEKISNSKSQLQEFVKKIWSHD